MHCFATVPGKMIPSVPAASWPQCGAAILQRLNKTTETFKGSFAPAGLPPAGEAPGALPLNPPWRSFSGDMLLNINIYYLYINKSGTLFTSGRAPTRQVENYLIIDKI
ncbi:MAG TPA: hypothetical protein VGC22_06955 [Chitinophaga sp.]